MYGTVPTYSGDVRGRCSCAFRAASQPGAISTRVAGAYRALRQSSPEDTRRTAALTFRNPKSAQPVGLGRHRSLASRYRDGGCGPAGDVTLASGAGQPVLAEAAGRLAAAIEAGDDLAVHVDDLAGGIDA